MTRDEAFLFLMGKMECLRFPQYEAKEDDMETFVYPKSVIVDLLKSRVEVMRVFGAKIDSSEGDKR